MNYSLHSLDGRRYLEWSLAQGRVALRVPMRIHFHLQYCPADDEQTSRSMRSAEADIGKQDVFSSNAQVGLLFRFS